MNHGEGEESLHATDQAVQVAQSFVALADALVDDFDVVELLDRLVRSCVRTLRVDAAAILLLNRDRALEVVASSDEASRMMEVVQLESHSGPCVDAILTGERVMITDLAELKRRWPSFGEAVTRVGFSAVYALPMRLRKDTIGALNLFNSTQPAMHEFDAKVAQAMADVATIGILQQRSHSRTSLLAEQLQLALNSRITVEQAKGVLAEYGGVDMGAAFEAIRSYAREHRVKLSAVAQQLVVRDLEPGRVIEARRTD
jgi:transcriptional regulator with GAF, ATPase, and Fis domain